MEAVKKDVSKRLEHLDGFGQTSLSTINNIIWPTFKNVAPLWTAHLLERKNSAKVQTDSFPCQLDRIHSFLARAEHIRKLGESSRPRQAVNTLLDPRTTWKVPANAFHIPSAGTGGTESAPDADRTDSVGSTHD
jgi:hypothetical protein